MSHFIKPDGPFTAPRRSLLQLGFELPRFDRHTQRKASPAHERQAALKQSGVEINVSPALIERMPETVEGKPTVVRPPVIRKVDRIKYICVGCRLKAWAATEVKILCGDCGTPLQPQQRESLKPY